MKKTIITYWTTTILISLMMLMSATMYVTKPELKDGFHHLGFSDSFRIELAIAKVLGAIALLLPMVNGRVKEWAYFGFFVTFVSAFIAHFTSGDPASMWMGPIIATVILLISYLAYQKKNSVIAA